MSQEETIEAQAFQRDILKGEFRVYFTRDASDIYERGYSKMALKLVQGGYIKKPTLRKLLEMANDKDDAQFAAILVDMLGESTKEGSKFAL